VAAAALRPVVAGAFGRCGMGEADAQLLAGSLVQADLRGVHSHGVLRVPEYVRRLTVDGVDPRARPRVVRDAGACLVVDGANAMGQIACHFAMRRVLERAGSSGLAAAAIRGSNHCGALAPYVLQAVERDMIGVATTNALPTMAPWGGAERLLGINPLAVGVPAGEELPVVYDGAFAAAAHGKVRVYGQKGLPLPPGWALDQDGQATTDPAAAYLLTPIGAFKGTALAMIMGILASLLSGAAYGTELGSMEAGALPGRDGQFVAAIRVGAFEDVPRFKARVDAAVRQLHACRPAPGVERVYAPGELEFATARRYGEEGIPLNDLTLADLRATLRGLDLPVPAWLA
jgi:LDH2 family malate/lactate/ureidoglycolate dehydrogenase